MLRFALGRLLTAIPTLFVIVTASFFMMRFAPGGPFDVEKAIDPQVLANLKRIYKLDQPLWAQYLDFLANLARGDLGPSYFWRDFTTMELFAKALPISVTLGLSALGLALADRREPRHRRGAAAEPAGRLRRRHPSRRQE